MAERINISIPEELHKRLSHFKDRLNMSKICQEAIAHAVRLEEIKAEAIPDIECLIDRLKEEKMQYGKEYIEEGFECGIKDAYKLSLDAFLEILFFREGALLSQFEEENYFEMFYLASDETKDHLKKLTEKMDVSGDERDIRMEQTFGLATQLEPEDFFCSGWLEGVNHIWEQVKPKLGRKAMMAKNNDEIKKDQFNPKNWKTKSYDYDPDENYDINADEEDK
ncbi:MAG TPA: hypothetical protein PK874_11825 [Desulfobacteraceae bacterium]|nr:hypothetical protein [Desulfobacteraceae bacterium]HPJ66735.1 hypothetical protein [Desulfobacteraceae bacterium]